MRLKKMELYGFKSFADRVEIDFDHGITGVVGPNGSGKSNIGDAMRWVLGEQSAKSLRGSKMEDVIFNGAQDRKPLSWCEVTLTFDNADGELHIDYTELAVTRRYYRTGESEYYINKAKCRRKDVIDLFRDTGIGKEGYSIVGQGQVEAVLSSKAEDRRNIFHEAAGIMKHRARRDEATRRLDHTQDNLQRLQDIMEEMERQLKPLKRQSKNARRFIELSDELKDLEVNRFLVTYDRLQSDLKKLEQELQVVEDITHQSEHNAEGLEDEAIKAVEEQQKVERMVEYIKAQYDEVAQRLSQRSSEEQVLKERVLHIEQMGIRLVEEMGYEQKRAEELIREACQLEDGLKNQNENEEERAREMESLSVQVETLQVDINERQEALDVKKERIMDNLNRLSDVKADVSRYETMLSSLKQRSEQVAEDIQSAVRDREIYDDAKKDIDQNIADMVQEINESQQKLKEEHEKRDDYKTKREALEQDVRKKEGRLQAAMERRRVLENLQRDHDGYSRAVKFLLENQEAQELIEGVVGEIIDVPTEYVPAVETALGRALQNIVTYSEYEAKDLIRMLRRNNMGRATFLPMTSIRGRQLKGRERGILNVKGCCGLASDLVNYDDRYSEIVSSLLGNTVICEDLDVAVDIAKQSKYQCRVVTLKGDMVNSGGAMSGGSMKSKSASVLGRQSEIDAMTSFIRDVGREVKVAQDAVQKINEDMDRQREAMDQLTASLNESQVALATEKERLSKVTANIEQNSEQMEALTMAQSQLAETMEDVNAQIERVNKSQGDMQQESEVSRESMEQEQGEINRMREERDTMVEHLNHLKILEAADEKEKQSVANQAKRLRADSQQLMEGIQKKQENAKQNELEAQTQQDKIAENASGQATDQAEIEKLKEQLGAGDQQLEAIREAISQIRQKHDEAQRLKMEIAEKRHQAELKEQRVRSEFEGIQDRLWDHYELTYSGAAELRKDDFEMTSAGEQIEAIRRKLRAMGTVNVNAVEDYAELNERYQKHKVQFDDLVSAEGDLMSVIGDLNDHMRETFSKEFDILNSYFSEAFTTLFGGGEARLIIQNPEDILESGIDIVAQPPGKRLQLLSLLSGGEKALTATAILFAMLRHRPSPFCLMDEIEAALDEANLNHFADYLKEYARKTQFVVITHRKPTMESCDTIYGVTMQEKGVSKMISMKISDYA